MTYRPPGPLVDRTPDDRPPPTNRPLPDEPVAPIGGGRIHRVKRGDTLWSLAQRYYGDNKQWRRIYSANQNRVPDPKDVPVGIKLIIP